MKTDKTGSRMRTIFLADSGLRSRCACGEFLDTLLGSFYGLLFIAAAHLLLSVSKERNARIFSTAEVWTVDESLWRIE